MKPQSAKAKGRRLQQRIVHDLMSAIPGVSDGDVSSRSMGANGLDIILSPFARRWADLRIECKMVEHLNVVSVFESHNKAYPTNGSNPLKDGFDLLIHSRNKSDILVTCRWSDLLKIICEAKKNTPESK